MRKRIIIIVSFLIIVVLGYFGYKYYETHKNERENNMREITIYKNVVPEKIYHLDEDVLLIKNNEFTKGFYEKEIKNNVEYTYSDSKYGISKKFLTVKNAEVEENVTESPTSKLNHYQIDIYKIVGNDLELYQTLDMVNGEYALKEGELYTSTELLEDGENTYLFMNDASENAKLYNIESEEMTDVKYRDIMNQYLNRSPLSIYNFTRDTGLDYDKSKNMFFGYNKSTESLVYHLDSVKLNENWKMLEEYPEIKEQDMLDSRMYVFNPKEEDFDYWFALGFKTGENPYEDIVLPGKESIDGEEHEINSLEDYKTYAKRFHE